MIVARIGGDEFALLLPDATPASTQILATSLRARFRNADPLDRIIPISASVGVGFAPNGRALAAAIAAADRGANTEKLLRGIRRT